MNHPSEGDVQGAHFTINLPNGKRLEPDIVVIPPNAVAPEEYEYVGVPFLIIEILSPSPSNRFHDLNRKKSGTENSVSEVWFIDPETREVLIYAENSGGNYVTSTLATATSTQFPGLELPLENLF